MPISRRGSHKAGPSKVRSSSVWATATAALRNQRVAPGAQQARFFSPWSLAAGLACLLVIAFLGTAGWRLGQLAAEAVAAIRFERPKLADVPPRPAFTPYVDEPLDRALRETGLPGGALGVSVRHLTSGATASLNPQRSFHAASLAKLPILVEVFKQQRLRHFTWDDELVITREQWTDGSGVLQARVGQSLKVGALLRLMIEQSDNIAANVLLDLVGVANVNRTAESMGLRQTHLPARGESSAPTTSADDLSRLLEAMASGKLIDAATSEEALRLLEAKQDRSWLSDGLPWWAKLAHKWGDVPTSRHDAGIIFTPRNQYVLVVLTESDNASLAAERIGQISRLVFDHFEDGARN